MTNPELDLERALNHRHPGTVGVARHFRYAHLPLHLQALSEPCAGLALDMITQLPDGPELTTGLRKLLEAKDCFVRAGVDHTGENPS